MKCDRCRSVIKDEFVIHNNEILCTECSVNINYLEFDYYSDRDTAIRELKSQYKYYSFMARYLENYDDSNELVLLRDNYKELRNNAKELRNNTFGLLLKLRSK